jgi:hypothetical protein
MTLSDLIAELRQELNDSKWFRLHSRVVPSSPEAIQISRWDAETERWQPNWDQMLEVLDTGNGMPLSRAAERFLEGKGIDAVPQRSLEEIGWFCHSRHASHCELDGCLPQGLPARTPLCERITRRLVEFQQPVSFVAARFERPVAEVESLAVQALRHAQSWRHRELHRYMKAARELERDTRIICPLCVGKRITMRRSPKAA